MLTIRYSCQILIELEFSGQSFEKASNMKFQKIRPLGAELFDADGRTDRHTDRRTYGRTDRQTDMTKTLVAFHNYANAL